MDYGPLVSEEIAAGEQLLQEFDRLFPVKIAFWLREAEEPLRFLYIASDGIDPQTRGRGYDEIARIIEAVTLPVLDWHRIHLVEGDDSLIVAVAKFARNYPNRPVGLEGIPLIYGVSAGDGYVYPTYRPAAA